MPAGTATRAVNRDEGQQREINPDSGETHRQGAQIRPAALKCLVTTGLSRTTGQGITRQRDPGQVTDDDKRRPEQQPNDNQQPAAPSRRRRRGVRRAWSRLA